MYINTHTHLMNSQMSPPRIAFALHILVELPASLGFFFRPSATLTTPHPEAHEIIRQYALLLTSTNLIAGIFLFQSPTSLSCQVAGALALYHVGPFARAIRRIRAGQASGILINPWIFLVIHAICATALFGEALWSES